MLNESVQNVPILAVQRVLGEYDHLDFGTLKSRPRFEPMDAKKVQTV